MTSKDRMEEHRLVVLANHVFCRRFQLNQGVGSGWYGHSFGWSAVVSVVRIPRFKMLGLRNGPVNQ